MSYRSNLLLLVMLQFFAFPTIACSRTPGYVPPTIPELFQKAKAVFTAHIYRTEEQSTTASADKTQIIILEGEFRVIETLKGTPPVDNKLKAVLSPCDNGVLIPGFDYIFFVREGHEMVSWSDGSRPLSIESVEGKKLLETLRGLSAVKGQP